MTSFFACQDDAQTLITKDLGITFLDFSKAHSELSSGIEAGLMAFFRP
jgi:hypothetical protein